MLAATLPNPIRRNAKTPSPGLRRLAATYVARSAVTGEVDRCILAGRRETN
jgi:monofunctional biosynthetic peptidoglycan transglycosylase